MAVAPAASLVVWSNALLRGVRNSRSCSCCCGVAGGHFSCESGAASMLQLIFSDISENEKTKNREGGKKEEELHKEFLRRTERLGK